MSKPDYEISDLPPKGAASALVGVLGGWLLIALIVTGILAWLGSERPYRAPAAPTAVPAPRLQVAALPERIAIENAAKARLKGDAGRPSIDEAMRLVAAAGWQDQSPAPPADAVARAHAEAGQ